MKKFLIITNCVGQEYIRHLNLSKEFLSLYDVKKFSTYETEPSKEYYAHLNSADVIVSQGAKNIKEYSYDFIDTNRKKNSIHIKLAFYRFNGFWPVQPKIINSNLWLHDEFGEDLSYEEYVNFQIDEVNIKNNFYQELEKLINIESKADIKILNMFLSNYKKSRMFNDNWHPNSVIISYICNEIFKIIDIKFDVPILDLSTFYNSKYRIVTNSVKKYLELDGNGWSRDLIFFGKYITEDHYYNFTKHIRKSGRHIHLRNQEDVKIFFESSNLINNNSIF